MRTIILILLISQQGVTLEAVARKRENVDSVKFQQFDNNRKGIRLRTRWKFRATLFSLKKNSSRYWRPGKTAMRKRGAQRLDQMLLMLRLLVNQNKYTRFT